MKTPLEMLIEISERTARMEEKLDAAADTADDHEERLRSVEKFRWAVPGAGVFAAVAAVVAFLPHP